jgi:two-component system, chemotaxis family, protein-glutamate methylesterase/glutaminase
MPLAGVASWQGSRARAADPVRVMLVDDSSVSRALMTRWIEESGAGRVVATASNGRAAIATLGTTGVDVVILDIEMPELDGLAALPRLLDAQPGVQVLMASSLSQRGASVTLEALRLGAADAIGKPRAGWAIASGDGFAGELAAKVRALGGVARRRRKGEPASAEAEPQIHPVDPVHPRAPASDCQSKAVVIGASTGGPNALFRLVEMLPRDLTVPVFITQHMPPTFTAILADHLTRHTRKPAHEAENGMLAEPGHIYIAPGGRHMSLAGRPERTRIIVSDEAPENFCRPSVNPLMRSAAQVYGPAVVGVMLTGMGADGLDGARELVRAGATLIAQDQATSVVWGMPGAVVRDGLAAEVLPLDDIAAAVVRQLGRPQ